MYSVNKRKIPFFSVIITTFNRDDIVSRAIDSLIAQSYTDWEAIIVDDGSTDNTKTIIDHYIQKYSNIRYLFHSNRGCGLSKTAGIIASTGLYITFLDSDDEYAADHLEIRKSILVENPEVALVHGGIKVIGDPFVPDAENHNHKIHLKDCNVGGTFFFRKDLFERIGGYSEKHFADDKDFFSKVEKAGLVIGRTYQETYIYHRDSQDSICNQIMKQNENKIK